MDDRYTLGYRRNANGSVSYILGRGRRRHVSPLQFPCFTEAAIAGHSDAALCRLMDARMSHTASA
jgi:hypothetical protein